MESQERRDQYELRPAPKVRYEDMSYDHAARGREIRVYHKVNDRLILSDFFVKL